jgi:mRNA interferase YafQ
MRTTDRSTAFRRDFKKARRDPRHRDLQEVMDLVLACLVSDSPLPERCRDHKLVGPWSGYRDCHVKPDLVLVYRKVGDNLLELVRLGTHSELFRK